ncbi:MAG: hypothetical protein K6D03_04630 [Solobacterium sp.]|nr:hypothetical protein [Solobacterium sp.]
MEKTLKQILKAACAAALAASAAACAGKKAVFGTELAEDGRGLILTAENADKGTSAGSGIEIKEGEHLAVTGNVESGSVQFRAVRDGNSDPSADWTFAGTGEEIEYDLEPGNYMIGFTAGENRTAGTVSALIKAAPAPETAETSADGQNPVMNFIGTYAKDRCMIDVSSADSTDGVNFSVRWSSSAAGHSEWHMSGKFDAETLTVNYDNCEKKDVVFKEDGSIESETVVYENGKGSFVFDENFGSLIWNDEEEHQADGISFGWALVD